MVVVDANDKTYRVTIATLARVLKAGGERFYEKSTNTAGESILIG